MTPDEMRDDLRVLNRPLERSHQAVWDSLNNLGPAQKVENYHRQLQADSGLGEEKCIAIMRLITWTFQQLYSSNLNPEEFKPLLAKSLSAELESDLDENGFLVAYINTWETLIATAGAAIKARLLANFNHNGFIDAHVMTDLRPILGYGDNLSVSGAIIFHQLFIDARKGDEVVNIHVTLDSDGLMDLISTLERAQAKARQVFKASQEQKREF